MYECEKPNFCRDLAKDRYAHQLHILSMLQIVVLMLGHILLILCAYVALILWAYVALDSQATVYPHNIYSTILTPINNNYVFYRSRTRHSFTRSRQS